MRTRGHTVLSGCYVIVRRSSTSSLHYGDASPIIREAVARLRTETPEHYAEDLRIMRDLEALAGHVGLGKTPSFPKTSGVWTADPRPLITQLEEGFALYKKRRDERERRHREYVSRELEETSDE